MATHFQSSQITWLQWRILTIFNKSSSNGKITTPSSSKSYRKSIESKFIFQLQAICVL
jgi:hypothetical protein